ncbi:Uncharacterised protein [Staphylococcus carnosus]|nr:hypothetical protein SCA04_04950 [Staphylococcus carnosus]GEP80596.1 hypothetical protein SCA05_23890 [Staphylococcus carnosus]SUL91016.1 Uncharacterised protein [Staphylococcus carnosus]SUM07332.1 Uncharacterised protein [Staphylococcus carnosus]
MKYKITTGIFFIILIFIYTFKVEPFLKNDNQFLNFLIILIIFIIGTLLGILGRKLDKK